MQEAAGRSFGTSGVVVVENGGHELLPLDEVQGLVVDFLATGRVRDGRLVLPPPLFLDLEEALQPPRPR